MVKIDGLDKLLAEHPFFSELDESIRELIAGCAANEVFQAGDFIYREGEKMDKFYVIRRGRVALDVHVPGKDPLVIETLQEGDILGWAWLIPPYKAAFDARAEQLVRAVSLDAACLRKKCEDDHMVGYEMYKRFLPVVAERLKAARMQLSDLYGNPKGK